MFRSAHRCILRKLIENGAQRIHYERARGHDVVPRYMSHESLSSPSYAKRFPPLVRPLPGLSLPPCTLDHADRNPTRITTLPNGLRIASEDALGPAASIGIYVDCGSIYEREESIGATHLLENLSFKSTRNRSRLSIIREVEATGGNVGASASREQMGYNYETLKPYLPEAVELLIDCVRNPLFLESEVEEQLTKIKREIEEINDPLEFLLESLHLTGYSGALGNPLKAPKKVLERINGSIIRKFYFDNYTADRIVLAAYGVDHEHLLTIAEPLLSDLNRGNQFEVPESKYIGGDFRHRQADSEKTHVALAFEVPGGWHDEKNSTALIVLQTLMGGGGSFSAGGPGKGMHSRLYLRVLNKHQEVHTFSAFSSVYNDTGLFGVQFTTKSDFVAKAVDVAAFELLAIATPGEVTELELVRAKNATKSAIMMNLESRSIITEDIGRQILTYGCRKPVEYFLKCLEELTLSDITMLAQKFLSSPLTMACYGDVDKVPGYDYVSQRFQTAA
ncbi:mitochondrial-processing peptidase subunit alpha-like isoform X3 [Iris pallida]|uniref:Mitochondrial-processing peptidase subunit alpha-like isoform X3 n=1 Tax=Iris pallida TaxID=29817 RepID=A0AAX6DFF6_IRIPA|nr:mitochondrial-processing peptidase subunit alpha-like isoform X3 [Iris pallida]